MSHWIGINGCIGVEPYYEALNPSKYKGYKVQLGNILSRNYLIDFWRGLRYWVKGKPTSRSYSIDVCK